MYTAVMGAIQKSEPEIRPKFQHHLIHFALRCSLGGGARLPLKSLQRIGALLGPAAFRLSARRRRRIPQHIQLAFPKLDNDEIKQLARDSARHFGMNLAEVTWMHRASREQVSAICSLSGVEHFEKAREAGKGAILVTGHCGNWEILNARLGIAGIPMVIAVRSLYDQRVDDIITNFRRRFGTEVVHRGKRANRELFRALAHNKVNGLLIDQDIKDIAGTFVPFFGRPTWTPTGAAVLSQRCGAPMIPGFIHRLADGTHHAEILEPITPPSNIEGEELVHELTALATQAIETQVRAHPAQWVWMHRRWRTQEEK